MLYVEAVQFDSFSTILRIILNLNLRCVSGLTFYVIRLKLCVFHLDKKLADVWINIHTEAIPHSSNSISSIHSFATNDLAGWLLWCYYYYNSCKCWYLYEFITFVPFIFKIDLQKMTDLRLLLIIHMADKFIPLINYGYQFLEQQWLPHTISFRLLEFWIHKYNFHNS